MARVIFTVLATCLLPLLLLAQTVEYNEEGERIIRFPDGSWRYYEPADSVYLESEKSVTTESPEEHAQNDISSATPALQDKISSSKKEIEAIEKEIVRLMERRVALNEQLLKTDDPKKKLDLNTELQKVIHSEKEQKRLHQDLQSELENLKAIAATSEEEQTAYLEGDSDTEVEDGEIKYDDGRSIKTIPNHIYEVEQECKVNKSKDDFSGRTKTQVNSSIFFEYTPKVMRSYLDEKAFITAYVSTFHIQGRFYLNLIVDVASDKARQTYGYINSNGQLMLQLVNGDIYTLKSTGSSTGNLMSNGKFTRYDVAYSMDPRMIKQLEKYPLNKIRLVWSTGYEDYDIYFVDVLKDQLTCLQSNL